MKKLFGGILGAFAMTALLVGASANAADKPDFEVILLGVGTPPPLMHRFGPATLVRVGGKVLLFDAGRGVTQRLWQNKIPMGKIDYLILTHLHSDHVVGIPDLMLTGWLNSPFGRRTTPMKVIGPKGTENLMNNLVKAYDWDIQTRLADQKLPPEGVKVSPQNVVPGPVLEEDGITVTAIGVNHGELIKPALGYRIDYDGRSVVISGDTKYNENLANKAKGADLFIHAVAAARPELLETAKFWSVILAHHTLPPEVGKIFSIAQPKQAALYHLVTLTNGKIKPVSPPELVAGVKAEYDGPVVAGADNMRFVIGVDGVQIIPPKK